MMPQLQHLFCGRTLDTLRRPFAAQTYLNRNRRRARADISGVQIVEFAPVGDAAGFNVGWGRAEPGSILPQDYPSSMNVTSIVTRYSLIFPSWTLAFSSTT
jgi:hypothetical protein